MMTTHAPSLAHVQSRPTQPAVTTVVRNINRPSSQRLLMQQQQRTQPIQQQMHLTRPLTAAATSSAAPATFSSKTSSGSSFLSTVSPAVSAVEMQTKAQKDYMDFIAGRKSVNGLRQNLNTQPGALGFGPKHPSYFHYLSAVNASTLRKMKTDGYRRPVSRVFQEQRYWYLFSIILLLSVLTRPVFAGACACVSISACMRVNLDSPISVFGETDIGVFLSSTNLVNPSSSVRGFAYAHKRWLSDANEDLRNFVFDGLPYSAHHETIIH